MAMNRDYRKYQPSAPSPLQNICDIPRSSTPTPESRCAVVVTSLDSGTRLKELHDRFATCGVIVEFKPSLDTSFAINGAIWIEYDSDSDAAQAISEFNETRQGWWGVMGGDIMVEYDQDGLKFAEAVAKYERENPLDENPITPGLPQRPCRPEAVDAHPIQVSFGATASLPRHENSRLPIASPLPLITDSTSDNHSSPSSSTTVLSPESATVYDASTEPISTAADIEVTTDPATLLKNAIAKAGLARSLHPTRELTEAPLQPLPKIPRKRKTEGLDASSTPATTGSNAPGKGRVASASLFIPTDKRRRVGSASASTPSSSASDTPLQRMKSAVDVAEMIALGKPTTSSSSSTSQHTQSQSAKWAKDMTTKTVSSPKPAIENSNSSSSTSTVPPVRANGIFKTQTKIGRATTVSSYRPNVNPASSSSQSQATASSTRAAKADKEKTSVARTSAGSSASKNADLPTKAASPALTQAARPSSSTSSVKSTSKIPLPNGVRVVVKDVVVPASNTKKADRR